MGLPAPHCSSTGIYLVAPANSGSVRAEQLVIANTPTVKPLQSLITQPIPQLSPHQKLLPILALRGGHHHASGDVGAYMPWLSSEPFTLHPKFEQFQSQCANLRNSCSASISMHSAILPPIWMESTASSPARRNSALLVMSFRPTFVLFPCPAQCCNCGRPSLRGICLHLPCAIHRQLSRMDQSQMAHLPSRMCQT